MREIKFRAWYETEKRMIEWREMKDDDELQYILENQLSDVSPAMQYSGLKDQNGVEIYEGDIVTWMDRPLRWYRNPNENMGALLTERVVFRDGSFRTDKYNELLINLCGNYDFNLLDKSEIKVIGNIYANPELLEGEGA